MERIRCKTENKDRFVSNWTDKIPFAIHRKRQNRPNHFTLKHKTINQTSISNSRNPELNNSQRGESSSRRPEQLKINLSNTPKAEVTLHSESSSQNHNRISFPVMRPHGIATEPSCNSLMKCHNPDNKCFCKVCDCGRHMCRLDRKLIGSFHGSTTYIKEYNEKKRNYDLKKEPDQGQTYPEKPNMYLNTTYTKDFDTKSPEKRNQKHSTQPSPEKVFGGPLSAFTSYNTQYIRRVGDNQYVKFKDNVHMNGILPFHGKSVYNRTFKDLEPGIRLSPFKPCDNVKIGGYWLGKSTYQRSFQKYSGTSKPISFAVPQKFETIPSFDKQFQTTYGKNFESFKPRVCPAKTALHHSKIQMSTQDRLNLPCNTDFKDFEYASKYVDASLCQ